MTSEEQARKQAAVMLAFAEGKQIECFPIGDEWVSTHHPTWNWVRYDYRVKKEVATIDWSHVNKKFRYLFKRGYSGDWLVSNIPPFKTNSGLIQDDGSINSLAENFASFKPVDCNSADSLVVRPEEV